MTEVEDLLLQAFWRGDLVMTLPGLPEMRDIDPRVRILNSCRQAPQDAGLLCVDRPEDFPPQTEELPDGSLCIDCRKRLVWPRDPAAQTPALLTAACRVLAAASWDDYHGRTKPVLAMLVASREDFAAFCLAAGYPLPPFWFKAGTATPTVSAESRCRA